MSPGIAFITGCPVSSKCFVACFPIDESQHPTCPHVRHIRIATTGRCSFSHSSQLFVFGVIPFFSSKNAL